MIGQHLQGGDVVDRLQDLFERWGAQVYLGEPVTMAGHMLQCAALAEADGAAPALVAAALLHDIGHFDGDYEDKPGEEEGHRHDALGAAVLEPFFPPEVTEPIRLHVQAKRYLCGTDAGYYGTLSEASKHSLALQGGAMDADEIARFSSLPFHEDAVRVRRWDDGGKAAELRAPRFDDFREALRSMLRVRGVGYAVALSSGRCAGSSPWRHRRQAVT